MNDYLFKVGAKNLILLKTKEFLAFRTYLKYKNNRTMIFDSELQAAIAEYQKHHSLKTQDGSLNEETYSQIGNEMTDVEIDMIALNHPKLKRMLYGVGLIDPCANWDTIAQIIPKDKFIGWGHPNVEQNCFDYAWKQLKVAGHDLKSPGWGTSRAMNPHIYQIYLEADIAGMKKGELAQQFTQGVLYLKKALKNGTPVIAGVDDGPGGPNKDKVTDHYVVIVGMGVDAIGKYFLFYDNALNPNIDNQLEIATSPENKLYCDCEQFLIKGEGDKRNKYIQKTEYKSLTVTHIRESK